MAPSDKLVCMSSETSPLNRIGVPPRQRTIHRRRIDLEAEAAARGERGAGLRNQLTVSIIALGFAIAASTLAWFVIRA
jgi:hypothetical protein